MKLFFITSTLWFSLTSLQIDKKIRRIVIQEYEKDGGTILPTKLKKEKILCVLDEGDFLRIHLYDYRGKMLLEHFSKDSILLEKGNYVNSFDLLRTYRESGEIVTGKQLIIVVEYYQPLREGKWFFYKNGLKNDSIIYKRGVITMPSTRRSL